MELGQYFGRFLIFGKIGVGGMGTVYAGFDPELLDFVAIKTLIADYNEDVKAVKRFEREAALYSRLAHPNIVGFVEAGVEKGVHYIALEYVRGKSLAEIIDKDRKTVLTFDRVVSIIRGVALGLKDIHSQDILHRDIKPSNIILTQDDTVKLLDFGIALAEDGLDLTGTGMILGTFVYSSPEQNQGRLLDERSDLYALGCVFFEMLTGQRALPGSTVTEVAKFQALPQLALPSCFNPDVPPELDRVVNKLLMPRSRDRYQDCDELLADLEALRRKHDDSSDSNPVFGDEVNEAWEMAKEAFSLGHIEPALEQVNFYLAQRPMDAKAHFLLGKLYAAKRLPFNASESFRQALDIMPDYQDYRLDFALALYRLEMYRQSLEQLQRILVKEPDNIPARGLAYIAEQDYEREKQRIAREEALAGKSGPASQHGLRDTIPYMVAPPPPPPRALNAGPSQSPAGRAAPSAPVRRFRHMGSAAAETGTSARGDVVTARRARLLSTFFPGLGELYSGQLSEFLRRLLVNFVLLGCLLLLVGAWYFHKPGQINILCSRMGEPVLNFALDKNIEDMARRYHDRAIPAAALSCLLIMFFHMRSSRKSAYSAVLRKALRGKVLHVRDDGLVQLDIGSLRGVELGNMFTLLKAVSSRQYAADVARTIHRKKRYVPYARAKVVKVRPNTSTAEVKSIGGSTSRPAEGDRVEPVL